MRFDVTILGSNSAIPTATRHPTSQLVNIKEKFYLIDCGEGSQMQLRRYGIKFQRISCVFISHLHGDHYFGLIGLLNTMHLLGREKEINIYAPKGLREIIQLQLDAAHGKLRFPTYFHTVDVKDAAVIHEDAMASVVAVPVKHKIETFGFVFEEKDRGPNIKKSFISEYQPGVEAILKIKKGHDFIDNSGRRIPFSEIVEAPKKQRKYAFITDTKASSCYHKAIHQADLLYHEATFMEDNRKRALDTKHSTAKQAGETALTCQVKKLIVGHFSTRYQDLQPLLNEAKGVFKNTELAEEGSVFSL